MYLSEKALKDIENNLFNEYLGNDFLKRPLEFMFEHSYDFYSRYDIDIENYIKEYTKYHNGVVNGTIGIIDFECNYKDPIKDTIKEYLKDMYSQEDLYIPLDDEERYELLDNTAERIFNEIERYVEQREQLKQNDDLDDFINSFESDITNTGDQEHTGHDEI